MSFPLPESITLWRRIGSDGLGGSAWEPPETHAARIAYSQTKFTDINGDQVTSRAVCYTNAAVTDAEIQRGVYVLLGIVSATPAPPAAADDVRAQSHTPSGAGALRKFWFA